MPPGAGAPMARPPMAAGAPGMPPGVMPRAKGGRVHPDEAEDKKLIMKTLKDQGLVRSDKAEHMGLRGRAAGGRLPNQNHHMDAGAVTGVGRLEKIGMKPKSAGKPQAV